MFDSINEKLSDRNFIQAAIDTASSAESRGPYGRTNSPFEQFRTHQAEKKNSTTVTTRSSTTVTHHSSSSSSDDGEESAGPSKANPPPETEKPDLFKSEFDDGDDNSTGSGNSTDGADGAEDPAAKAKAQAKKAEGLHKKHGKVSVSGGAHTGKKP